MITTYGKLFLGDKFKVKNEETTWIKVAPGTCCKSNVANAYNILDEKVTKVFNVRDQVILLQST